MSNPIEMIKAYHAIKSYLSESDQKDLIKKLGLTEVDLTTRMSGKDKEIEFILTLYLLKSCKHIIGFEEGVSSLTKSHTPDLLVELHDGKRIFIEIKSTEKEEFKFQKKQKKNFKNTLEFVKSFNYPLYYAINVNSFWMLFESSYIEKENYKITAKNFLDSKFDEITGNRTFLIPRGLKIISYYSKTATEHLEIGNSDFGNLVHYSFFYNERLLFKVDVSDKTWISYVYLLEGFQDIMSMQSQEVSPISNDVTKIVECTTEELSLIDSRYLIQAPISHILHDLGGTVDLNSYFRDVASYKNNILSIDVFEDLINNLKNAGIPILEKNKNNGELHY